MQATRFACTWVERTENQWRTCLGVSAKERALRRRRGRRLHRAASQSSVVRHSARPHARVQQPHVRLSAGLAATPAAPSSPGPFLVHAYSTRDGVCSVSDVNTISQNTCRPYTLVVWYASTPGRRFAVWRSRGAGKKKKIMEEKPMAIVRRFFDAR